MTSLAKVLNECLSKSIPFVCFREAGKSIRAFSGEVLQIDLQQLSQDNLPSGFIFAPFDLHHQPTYFIPETTNLFEQALFISESVESKSATENPFPETRFHSTEYSDYAAEFEAFLQQIHYGDLQKVVASRRTLIPALPVSEYAHLFIALTENYTTAFVYWIFLPETGSWIGASPETLLSSKGQKAKTMALAGTRHPDQEKSTFGLKEKTEQAFVSAAIEDEIRKYADTISIEGPLEVNAGRLIHLQTSYQFDLDQKDFLPLALALHPTPAVGGVPKLSAWNAILQTESQPRNFYCGFLGYIHPTFGGSLFVNLRCMEIFNESICLYSGGGLTEDSILADEWKETGYKNETLLSVIEKIRKFAGK